MRSGLVVRVVLKFCTTLVIDRVLFPFLMSLCELRPASMLSVSLRFVRSVSARAVRLCVSACVVVASLFSGLLQLVSSTVIEVCSVTVLMKFGLTLIVWLSSLVTLGRPLCVPQCGCVRRNSVQVLRPVACRGDGVVVLICLSTPRLTVVMTVCVTLLRTLNRPLVASAWLKALDYRRPLPALLTSRVATWT